MPDGNTCSQSGQTTGNVGFLYIRTTDRIPQVQQDLGNRSEERRVGKDVSVRVDLGGRRIIKKKKKTRNLDSYILLIHNQHDKQKQSTTISSYPRRPYTQTPHTQEQQRHYH